MAPPISSLHMTIFYSQIGYMISLLHLEWILITIIVQQLHRFECFVAIKKTPHPPPSLGLYVCLYTRLFQWNHLLVNFSNTSPLHHHLWTNCKQQDHKLAINFGNPSHFRVVINNWGHSCYLENPNCLKTKQNVIQVFLFTIVPP
jgi:hypothetical protein